MSLLFDTTHQFINLPEVVQRIILDSLELGELLKLRLVSHSVSSWISEDYLQKRISSIYVGIGDLKTLNEFMSTGSNLPFTRFSFSFTPMTKPHYKLKKNKYVDYNCKAMKNFAHKFGSRIKHLYVSEMYMCITDSEFQFYESLTSLKSLQITKAAHRKHRGRVSTESIKLLMESTRVPSQTVLTHLEMLTFDRSFDFYQFDFLSECPNLRKLYLGWSYNRIETPEDFVNKSMKRLTDYINKRLHTQGKFDLEIDFAKISEKEHIEMMTQDTLQEFINAVYSAGVKLISLSGHFLDSLQNHSVNANQIEGTVKKVPRIFGLPAIIYECTDLKQNRVTLEVLPEEELQAVGRAEFPPQVAAIEFPDLDKKPEWKSLQEIELKIIRWEEDPYSEQIGTRSKIGLHQWLAGTLPLELRTVTSQDARKITEFILGTTYEVSRNEVRKVNFSLQKECTGVFVTPEDFGCRFPNLQHLRLQVESFSSEDYTQLFRLLGEQTKINYLRLVSSVEFTDETFMGSVEDSSAPFGTMKHLEVFELASTHPNHPNITDKFFIEVLQGMSLHVFLIQMPNHANISEAAFTALLEGPFAKSIRSFLFDRTVESERDVSTPTKTYEALQDICKENNRLLSPKYEVHTSADYPTYIWKIQNNNHDIY